LVARTTDRLTVRAAAIAAEHGVAVETITADLFDDSGVELVEARLRDAARPIDVLINNAGHGLLTDFAASDIDDELRHLDLHVTVPLRLSHAVMQGMLARGHGRIVLISSVAAFTPRGTYGAAKAWGVSFARWANLRYRGDGVTVTAVAPGFTRTEFHSRMGASTTGIPAFLWLSVGDLVRSALRDVERGKAVSIPTVRYKVISALARALPARVAAAGSLAPQR
jgi:uncharacterized protein